MFSFSSYLKVDLSLRDNQSLYIPSCKLEASYEVLHTITKSVPIVKPVRFVERDWVLSMSDCLVF